MAVTIDKPSPYAPASAILDLIERHRNRGLPSPINAEVLGRAGIADSLIPRTLQALQVVDLVDEQGRPTAVFEGFRLAKEDEYKPRLQEWLKAAYADVFSFVDPTVDDETEIRDAFRSYQPVGQQGRMVTLFQGLCAAAGLVPEKKAAQVRLPSSRSRAEVVKRLVQKTPARAAANLAKPSANEVAGLPAALAGMLTTLPPDGQGWSQDKRDSFMKTFGTVLDFCFPIVESGTARGQEEQSQ